jgi:hypothetical protein
MASWARREIGATPRAIVDFAVEHFAVERGASATTDSFVPGSGMVPRRRRRATGPQRRVETRVDAASPLASRDVELVASSGLLPSSHHRTLSGGTRDRQLAVGRSAPVTLSECDWGFTNDSRGVSEVYARNTTGRESTSRLGGSRIRDLRERIAEYRATIDSLNEGVEVFDNDADAGISTLRTAQGSCGTR